MKNANPVSDLLKMFVAAGALAVLAGLAGCRDDERTAGAAAGGARASEAKPATAYFTIKVGAEPVRMQLAVARPDSMAELNRGLMGRRDLAEDQGMIFVYQQPQQMGFYMRNTPTPLDIGFFTADGVLREVRQMFPFDETTVLSARDDIMYALEMNQGWYARHNVQPVPLSGSNPAAEAAAKLDMKAFAEALKARGFNPDTYGMAGK